MKTFRWTVPEPPLSPTEKLQHLRALGNRGLPDEPPLVSFEGRDWWERQVIHFVNNPTGFSNLVPFLLMLLMFASIGRPESRSDIVWLVAIIAFLKTYDHFYQRAVGRIIIALEKNQPSAPTSEPASENSASPSTEATEST